MATVNNTRKAANFNQRVAIHTWGPMLNGDVGDGVAESSGADRSVQITGTFGVGGSVQIEGSNDGNNWNVLSDPLGNPLVFTSSKLRAIMELAQYVRPNVTAGDGTTSLTVAFLTKE